MLDLEIGLVCVAYLGDGNVPFAVGTKNQNLAVQNKIEETAEDILLFEAGSFSYEHGIGINKLTFMK